MNNHKGVVEVLLRSGADPSIPNAAGLIAAELTSNAAIRESLMNTNWMSQSNVYPKFEQQRHINPTSSLSSSSSASAEKQQQRGCDKMTPVPPLEMLLLACESSGEQRNTTPPFTNPDITLDHKQQQRQWQNNEGGRRSSVPSGLVSLCGMHACLPTVYLSHLTLIATKSLIQHANLCFLRSSTLDVPQCCRLVVPEVTSRRSVAAINVELQRNDTVVFQQV
jgi:hypothetical protein